MKRYTFYICLAVLALASCTSKIDFDITPATGPTVTSDLLLSEISTAINTDPNAAAARNHYVEIYNGTASATVDLSDYAIGYQASTDLATLTAWTFPTGNFLTLTGSLAKGKCYVIASPQVDPLTVKYDITWGTTSTTAANASSPLQLSGNSAIALLKKDAAGTYTLGTNKYKIIDVFGSPLVARITASGATSSRNNFVWTVAGETETRNRTFWRKKTVKDPTTNWATAQGTSATDSQWDLSPDRAWDYTNIGLPSK
jgi:hypothetical protein